MGYARLTAARRLGPECAAAGRRLGNTGLTAACATAAGMGHARLQLPATAAASVGHAECAAAGRRLGNTGLTAACATAAGMGHARLQLPATGSHIFWIKWLIRTGMGTISSACGPVGHTRSAATSGSARVMATIIPTAVFCSLCSRQQSCYPTLAAARSFQHEWAWRAGDGTTGANVWR